MRTTLLTVAMLLAMNSDLQVLLWVVGLAPAAGALMFIGFLLRPAARRREPQGVWQEGERHLDPTPPRQGPAHRADSPRWPAGKHRPARGRRLQGLSRQAQLEEHTVSVDAASILRGLDRPEGQPEIGRNGFHSWD